MVSAPSQPCREKWKTKSTCVLDFKNLDTESSRSSPKSLFVLFFSLKHKDPVIVSLLARTSRSSPQIIYRDLMLCSAPFCARSLRRLLQVRAVTLRLLPLRVCLFSLLLPQSTTVHRIRQWDPVGGDFGRDSWI